VAGLQVQQGRMSRVVSGREGWCDVVTQGCLDVRGGAMLSHEGGQADRVKQVRVWFGLLGYET
jgi:hypothetical protein